MTSTVSKDGMFWKEVSQWEIKGLPARGSSGLGMNWREEKGGEF